MKVKLTGIIEVQVEVETEIVDLDHFYEWCRGPAPMEDIPGLYLKYLREFTDEKTEIWATVTRTDIENGEVLSAEFVEAEVHGRG